MPPILKFIGQQDLPDLAKELKLSPLPNDHGVSIKVRYEGNGQPVEEAFFGVYYSSQGGNDAKSVGQLHIAANMVKQTNWGFRSMQSSRAAAGTVDKRMPFFCLMAKSCSQMKAQESAVNASVAKIDATLRGPGFDDSWLRTSGGGSTFPMSSPIVAACCALVLTRNPHSRFGPLMRQRATKNVPPPETSLRMGHHLAVLHLAVLTTTFPIRRPSPRRKRPKVRMFDTVGQTRA